MDSAMLRRLIGFLVTPGVALANRKWGLGLEAGEVEAIAAASIGYVAQSAWKEAAIAKAAAAGNAAAAQVVTLEDARKLLREAGKALVVLLIGALSFAAAPAFAQVADVDAGVPSVAILDNATLPAALTPTEEIASAKVLAACVATNRVLTEEIRKAPDPVHVGIVAGAVGIVLGILGGLGLSQLKLPSTPQPPSP